jgi:hypothetical protein
MKREFLRLAVWVLAPVSVMPWALAQDSGEDLPTHDLETVTIRPAGVANEDPSGTYASPLSALRFAPGLDVQGRGFVEAQGDLSIRGGTFENTGWRIGGLNLWDPQTGHYLAEIPLDPAMLESAAVATGIDHAKGALNSTSGSVVQDWNRSLSPMKRLQFGFGEHQTHRQSLFVRQGFPKVSSALDVGLSRSESDGPIVHGDHQFERASLRYFSKGQDLEWVLAGGYQDKFFGWPNLYTPFGVPETESIQTFLVMADVRARTDAGDTLRFSSYFRENRDDYEFDRTRPGIFNPYQHTSRIGAFHGEWERETQDGATWGIRLDGMADAMDSTSLTRSYLSRTYTRASMDYLSPVIADRWTLHALLAHADTNRNSSSWNPAIQIRHDFLADSTRLSAWSLGYSRKSQVSAYTATASAPSGLFGGNPDLDVQVSDELEFSLSGNGRHWGWKTTLFWRMDRDLTDWTFSYSRPNARSAREVDADTLGIDLEWFYRASCGSLALAYRFLDKTESYADPLVDASFYALNIPNHRFTASWVLKLSKAWEMRWDQEWRQQRSNPLRRSSREAWLGYWSLVFKPLQAHDWTLRLSVDNLWDSDFEAIPSVPASPRQVSFETRLQW